MNERILGEPNQVVRRFFALDTQTYQAGALDVKTKELLGLVASMVLRCDDCISYHVAQCKDAGVTREEFFETFSVGLVVGGSIVIPHLRRAVDFLDQLEGGAAARQRTSTECSGSAGRWPAFPEPHMAEVAGQRPALPHREWPSHDPTAQEPFLLKGRADGAGIRWDARAILPEPGTGTMVCWDLGPGSGIIAGETSFAPAFPGTSGRRFSCSEHRSMTQKITVIRGDGIGPKSWTPPCSCWTSSRRAWSTKTPTPAWWPWRSTAT